MPRLALNFGELRPDDAPHNSPGLVTASGVYASANGYRPIGAFQQFAEALPGTFKGGGAFISDSGTARMVAGDGTSLYSATNSGVWTSVISGLSVNGRWGFTRFGDDVICVNGGVPIAFNITANTAAALTGSPPVADLCATCGDFVILGRVDGAQATVQWSGQGDDRIWSAGTALSGAQPIYAGGKIMALTSGEVCYIIQRFQVTRMSFTGDATDPFQFDPISTNEGCASEGSFVQAGALHFLWSDRGFRMFDGAQYQPIGAERIDAAFRNAYSSSELDSSLWATTDPTRSLAIWVIQNKLWIYNWVLNRWATADISAFAAFQSFTSSVSIDDLDAIYGDLDSIPYSLDDPRFSGGAPRLTLVNAAGTFGTLSGDPMAARITMPFLELASDREARVQRVEPITDAIDGMTLTTDARIRLGDTAAQTSTTTLNDSGYFFPRVAARRTQFQLDMLAGTSWAYLQGLGVEFAAGGRV